MKKTILVLLTILTFAISKAQEIPELNKVPNELVGIWKNFDNEFLMIRLRGDFERVDSKGRRLAVGIIEVKEDTIKVIRKDINDEYSLGYLVNDKTFVVSKPRQSNRAWLFNKVK